MVPNLMQSFSVGAGVLGILVAFYFYAYASMQIPVGLLLDRFGARKLLTLATFLCAIGSFTFANAHNLQLAEIGRTLTGFGSAFAAVGGMSLIARWFPPRRFAFMIGILLTIAMLGAAAGEAPLAIIIAHLGWRGTLNLLAAIGLALCILIVIIVRDHPPEQPDIMKPQTQDGFITGLKYVIRNPQSWLASIYAGLIFLPTTAFAALWGVPFLITAYGLSRPVAALYVSLIFIGWAVGAPINGFISDYMRRRKPPMIVGAVGSLISLTSAIYFNMPIFLLVSCLFAFGFFSSGFVTAFSLVREINPHRFSATSLGFTNMMNMVGGAVAQPLIGVILDHHWAGLKIHGVRFFSVSAYHNALMVIPISLLIALLILPFIKETYCRSFESITDSI